MLAHDIFVDNSLQVVQKIWWKYNQYRIEAVSVIPVLWGTEILIFASVSRLDVRPSMSVFILVQVFKRYTLTLEYFIEINKFTGTERILVVLPSEVKWKGYEVNHSPPSWYFHGMDGGNVYTTPTRVHKCWCSPVSPMCVCADTLMVIVPTHRHTSIHILSVWKLHKPNLLRNASGKILEPCVRNHSVQVTPQSLLRLRIFWQLNCALKTLVVTVLCSIMLVTHYPEIKPRL